MDLVAVGGAFDAGQRQHAGQLDQPPLAFKQHPQRDRLVAAYHRLQLRLAGQHVTDGLAAKLHRRHIGRGNALFGAVVMVQHRPAPAAQLLPLHLAPHLGADIADALVPLPQQVLGEEVGRIADIALQVQGEGVCVLAGGADHR